MVYLITGPEQYQRKIAGVQFENGKAKTESGWIAQWFSGRPGFSVVPEKKGGREKPEK